MVTCAHERESSHIILQDKIDQAVNHVISEINNLNNKGVDVDWLNWSKKVNDILIDINQISSEPIDLNQIILLALEKIKNSNREEWPSSELENKYKEIITEKIKVEIQQRVARGENLYQIISEIGVKYKKQGLDLGLELEKIRIELS
ncbi:MAG: hypothetical protein PHS07_03045 [Patescibacteria group bacterium]|nr:hypothetical protein [Patescibacteria group bacterium]